MENSQFQEEAGEIIARTKQLKQQQALANTRATRDVSDESMFNGFNTVIDEIEEIKRIMELNKKAAELKTWNQEKKIVTMCSEMKKLERSVTVVATNLQDLGSLVESNTVRIGKLEEKQYNLGLTVKGVEKKVLKRVSDLVEWMEGNEIDQSTPIRNAPGGENLLTVRKEVRELKDYISEEKRKISDIKGSVKMVGSKLDETISGLSSMSTARLTDDPSLGGGPGVEQTRNIIKLGIQRHVLQISQLIGIRLNADNPDLKLIEKCNNLDVPKISKAVTSCGDALEKYVKIPRFDKAYVDEVTEILIEATNWCLRVEGLYSKMEIHSTNNTKGVTSEIGIFTDNSTQTIYEFFQE